MVPSKEFQRIGAESNAHVGADFENAAQRFFSHQGIELEPNLSIELGIEYKTKPHRFDLGCAEKKVIVECKSHRWTKPNDNVPSAKLTVWNEAMLYFLTAPRGYRKILFVLRDFSSKRGETLAEYYIRIYGHLIPSDVEIWEFDEQNGDARKLIN